MNQEMYMDMVATMISDRTIAKTSQKKIDLSEKKARMYESKCIALESEIAYLKANAKTNT